MFAKFYMLGSAVTAVSVLYICGAFESTQSSKLPKDKNINSRIIIRNYDIRYADDKIDDKGE